MNNIERHKKLLEELADMVVVENATTKPIISLYIRDKQDALILSNDYEDITFMFTKEHLDSIVNNLPIDDAKKHIAMVCAYYFSEPAASIADIIFKLFMNKIDQ